MLYQRLTILRNSVSTSTRPMHPDLPRITDLGNISANVKAIFHNKAFVESTDGISEDTTFGVLLDKTSFYAESGGQEYDTGNIVIDGVADFEVTNVQVYNGYVLHTGHLKYGQLHVGDQVVSSYDEVSHDRLCSYQRKSLTSSKASSLAITQ